MPASGLPWPDAPTHRLSESGTYFVSAGTYRKAHYFGGANRLRVLHRGLQTLTRKYGWSLEAWSVFSNHYHFVAHSPADAPDASNLSEMFRRLRRQEVSVPRKSSGRRRFAACLRPRFL